MSETLYSRVASSPLGKCTEDLKTKIPEETKLQFQRMANRAGATDSELLRDLVFLAVHGKTYGEYCSDVRRAVLNTEGAVQGHFGALEGNV